MAHLHHFHPSVRGLNLGSLCACSPGPRFHYSELRKQITVALLKCWGGLLIDNECWLCCLLCSMHHVPPAHGSASYTPLPSWPTRCFPDDHSRTPNTHTHTHINPSIRVVLVQGQQPPSWIESLLIMQADGERNSLLKSIRWPTLPRKVSYSGCATADAVRCRRLSNLCWFALTLTLEKRSG